MRMSNAKALLGYGVFLLAASSEAHQIWYEQPPGQPLSLYYGEYEKNVLEVTPGGMDRFVQLQGWPAGTPSRALPLTLQRQGQPRPLGQILLSEGMVVEDDLKIALAAMADSFIANANAAGIPMDVLHRVASMASGGMDTLPHNGAVITLLAVTGLSHRQSYKDIFAITLIKTSAVFVVIGVFYATGLV